MKKYYFINKFNTNNIDKQDKQTTIIFRNYSSKKIEEDLIIKIKNYCKRKSLKFFLANNIKLAMKLNLDGAYIPAFNKSFIHNSYRLKKNFQLIGSAHNLAEIRIKEKQNVSSIFISSIFKNNKSNQFLGIYRFLNLMSLTKKNVICLGGINKDNVKKIDLLSIGSFGSISMLENYLKL